MAAALILAAQDVQTTSGIKLIQGAWAARSMRDRLRVLKTARHRLAAATDKLVQAIPKTLARNDADSMVAEVLPLLAACEFLERQAAMVLAPRNLGRKGLPFWLAGVHSSVERAALGQVLVIGPANYPLFLPGVQVLQALAAGNAVIWKPGTGGLAVAEVFAAEMERAGLPDGLLEVKSESAADGIAAMKAGVEKVFFTGSAASGRAVMRMAAETLTPVVAELSGCDAVFVLPSADANRVVEALAFGMRLNGSATCMAPRRLVLIDSGHAGLIARLRERFAAMDDVFLADETRLQVEEMVSEAEAQGAKVCGDARSIWMKPLLLLNGRPEMRIAQSDVFAPLLTVIEVDSVEDAVALDTACPFGLTASVFGDENAALALGAQLSVGTLLVNDLIVPTADPRVPFGGRRGSGFGPTRGAEGLLEMTVAKTVLVRRGKGLRQYAATGDMHAEMFAGVIGMGHAQGLGARWKAMRAMAAAAMKIGK